MHVSLAHERVDEFGGIFRQRHARGVPAVVHGAVYRGDGATQRGGTGADETAVRHERKKKIMNPRGGPPSRGPRNPSSNPNPNPIGRPPSPGDPTNHGVSFG